MIYTSYLFANVHDMVIVTLIGGIRIILVKLAGI